MATELDTLQQAWDKMIADMANKAKEAGKPLTANAAVGTINKEMANGAPAGKAP
jgi:hypothetical protein